MATGLLLPGAVAAETVTVAMLGDSLTAGYGLPREEGLVPQLQAWLDAQGADVVLLNAGVSGDTTAGGLSRVAWTLTEEVDAMVVALGGNDYLRGLDPAQAKANLDGILAAGQERGVALMIVGLLVGGQYGAEYQAAFNAAYPELAERYDAPLYRDIFDGIRAVAGTTARAQDYLQRDGIHPNAEGVAAIVADLGPALLAFIEEMEKAR